MLDKLLQPMIDNILANYGLTRADVYRLQNEALAFAQEARMHIPGVLARIEAMEQALHTQTEALRILLEAHNKEKADREALQLLLSDQSRQEAIAAKSGQDINGYPLIKNGEAH